MGQESQPRLIGEDFLPASGEADHHQPDQRNARNPHVSCAMHFDQYGGCHTQSNRSQQLIADSEWQLSELMPPNGSRTP